MNTASLIDNYADKLKHSGSEAKRNDSSLHCGAKGAELEAKRLSHFEDSGETGVSFTGHRFIQLLKPETGITRQLIHALSTKNSDKCRYDKRRVDSCVLNARVKVKNHVLIGLEELRNIPLFQFDVTHIDLLKPPSNLEGSLNTFTTCKLACGGDTVRSSCSLVALTPARCNSSVKRKLGVPFWVA